MALVHDGPTCRGKKTCTYAWTAAQFVYVQAPQRAKMAIIADNEASVCRHGLSEEVGGVLVANTTS